MIDRLGNLAVTSHHVMVPPAFFHPQDTSHVRLRVSGLITMIRPSRPPKAHFMRGVAEAGCAVHAMRAAIKVNSILGKARPVIITLPLSRSSRSPAETRGRALAVAWCGSPAEVTKP